MKLKFTVLAAAAALIVLSGCAGVEVAKGKQLSNEQIAYSGSTVAHLNATNWGFYFFMFPVLTGSTSKPGEMVFFQDTVRTDAVVKMLTAESRKLGATRTLNMISRHSTNAFFFSFKEVAISANAVR